MPLLVRLQMYRPIGKVIEASGGKASLIEIS